jgi:flagellar biosynthetic protein FlhB
MPEEQEKTEEPTPKRREDARKKGQVARSQDLNTAVLLLAGMGLLYFFGARMRDTMAGLMIWAFTHIHDVDFSPAGISQLFLFLNKETLVMIAPFTIGLMLIGVAVSLVQVGVFVSWDVMAPDWNKVNPISGFQRLFSTQAIVRVVMAIFKLAVIGTVTYWAVVKDLPTLFHLDTYEVRGIFATICMMTFWLIMKMGLAMLILALLDWFYQRYQHEQRLKMSRQEIKEEMRQYEGDPLIKSKRRQKMIARAYQRMMRSVPKADVVVTNPTHVAVALQYDPSAAEAPLVVAKGQRLIAERIKTMAREHNIPIVEDKPLARALFQTVEVGQEVPPALYRAVAKVIGYIYRLKRKKPPRKALGQRV